MRASIIRTLIVSYAILAFASLSFAQSGSYFIANYNPGEQNFDNTNYAVLQDEMGVMHFANRQGVLHFDGNSWWLSPTPYSIFCLADANELENLLDSHQTQQLVFLKLLKSADISATSRTQPRRNELVNRK